LAALPEVTRVLLVEDNDELRRELARTLTDNGYAVEAVRTLGAGLDVARLQSPHIIITELLVPDARSYRFADAYRAIAGASVVIFAVTRLPQLIFDNARRAGFDEVFSKPLNVAELLVRIEHATLARSA
jgi:DNA-binding response OmpR family regulator